MERLNQTQQSAIISLFATFIDVIVDQVTESVLTATAKKEPKDRKSVV